MSGDGGSFIGMIGDNKGGEVMNKARRTARMYDEEMGYKRTKTISTRVKPPVRYRKSEEMATASALAAALIMFNRKR